MKRWVPRFLKVARYSFVVAMVLPMMASSSSASGESVEVKQCTREISPELLSRRSQCPTSPGFAPLTNLHPPTALLVGYLHEGGSTALVRALSNWSLRQSVRVPVHVIVSSGQWTDALQKLAEFRLPPYNEFVQFLESDHRPTIWMQDFMELGVRAGQPRPVILDLPSYFGDGADVVPQDLAAKCEIPLIDQEQIPFESEAEDSSTGGNIEAFPGGVVALSKKSDPGLVSFLTEQTGKEPLALDLSWLEVGHMDEMVSLVPMSQDPCGFALLRASPEEALRLFRSKSPQEQSAPIEPGENPLTAKGALANLQLVKTNLVYEKIIRKEVEKLRMKIQGAQSCKKIPVIPLPVLFRPGVPVEDESNSLAPPAPDINPNPINSLVLEKTIFVPEQANAWLQEAIGKRLKDIGLEPTFVNVDHYHRGHGHVHCATNVIRTCAPTQVKNAFTGKTKASAGEKTIDPAPVIKTFENPFGMGISK